MIHIRHSLCLLVSLVGLVSTPGELEAENVQRPNILWIIAEDMSPDLGCYGNRVVTTPNLDALADKGMRFSHVFTTGPACSPSRTALATGVYQTTLGAHHMRYSERLKPALPRGIKVLPELMREEGYFTGNIKDVGGTGTGKDDWLFQSPAKTWDTKSWQELVEHQPFFAQINSKQSHRKFSAAADIPRKEIDLPPYYPDHPVTRDDWAGYLNSVNQFDAQVGAILGELRKANLDENTIVFVFSDHGRPMIRGKNWLYDSGTQIPLIVYVPDNLRNSIRYSPGTVGPQLLSAIDIVAETLLMVGGEIPSWMQGRSFLRTHSSPRTYLHTAVDRIGNIESCSRAVRTDRFKYIRNFKTPGSINECSTAYRRETHPIYHLLRMMSERNTLNEVQAQLLAPLASEELYDLAKDPHETRNLIGKQAYETVHQELEKEMHDWTTSSKDQGLQQDSIAIAEHFEAYGASTFKQRAEGIERMRSAVAQHFRDR